MSHPITDREPEAKTFRRSSLFARLPWIGFGVTLLFLVLIAAATDRVTNSLASDEVWVSHSQDVERILGRLRGDFLAAETSRLLYVVTGNETRLEPYFSVSQRIPGDIDQLKALTGDNPAQQKQLDGLRLLINRRDGALKELVALGKNGGETAKQQADLALTANLSNQAMNIIQRRRDDEDVLLKQRQTISRHTYETVRVILAAAFLAVVVMLALMFRRFWTELRQRIQAESSVRKLNVRILQLQDTSAARWPGNCTTASARCLRP